MISNAPKFEQIYKQNLTKEEALWLFGYIQIKVCMYSAQSIGFTFKLGRLTLRG